MLRYFVMILSVMSMVLILVVVSIICEVYLVGMFMVNVCMIIRYSVKRILLVKNSVLMFVMNCRLWVFEVSIIC